MEKPVNLRTVIGAAAVAGLALGGSLNVFAADTGARPDAAQTRFVYVPHKSGYPFNLFEVPRETAEFARVETARDEGSTGLRPPPKTGHPFLHLK